MFRSLFLFLLLLTLKGHFNKWNFRKLVFGKGNACTLTFSPLDVSAVEEIDAAAAPDGSFYQPSTYFQAEAPLKWNAGGSILWSTPAAGLWSCFFGLFFFGELLLHRCSLRQWRHRTEVRRRRRGGGTKAKAASHQYGFIWGRAERGSSQRREGPGGGGELLKENEEFRGNARPGKETQQ